MPDMKYLSIARPRSALLELSSIISAPPSMKKWTSGAEELLLSRTMDSLICYNVTKAYQKSHYRRWNQYLRILMLACD